jgi:hypothetical protein
MIVHTGRGERDLSLLPTHYRLPPQRNHPVDGSKSRSQLLWHRQQKREWRLPKTKKGQVPVRHQHVHGPCVHCPVVDHLMGVDQFSALPLDHPLPSESCPRPKLVNASILIVVERRRQVRHLGCAPNNSSNTGLCPESRAQTANSQDVPQASGPLGHTSTYPSHLNSPQTISSHTCASLIACPRRTRHTSPPRPTHPDDPDEAIPSVLSACPFAPPRRCFHVLCMQTPNARIVHLPPHSIPAPRGPPALLGLHSLAAVPALDPSFFYRISTHSPSGCSRRNYRLPNFWGSWTTCMSFLCSAFNISIDYALFRYS